MSEEKEVRVVMVPWLEFGHMIPFLDLSIALAKFGIHVSISTSRNIGVTFKKVTSRFQIKMSFFREFKIHQLSLT